jgi:hypothetical protein
MNPKSEIPRFNQQPQAPKNPNLNNLPNLNDLGLNTSADAKAAEGRGLEQEGSWAKSVARSRSTRQATKVIINTRADFKEYLAQYNLGLVTSAVEFQRNGDFIASSYIVYLTEDNKKEPLRSFLKRFPQLQEAVQKIRDSLRPVQNKMQVITRPSYYDRLEE